MGFTFPIRFANIVAYLTTTTESVEAPLRDFQQFFEMLREEPTRMLSSFPNDSWQQQISSAAREAEGVVRRFSDRARTKARNVEGIGDVPDDERSNQAIFSIEEIFAENPTPLSAMHLLFGELFEIFVLGVPDRDDTGDVRGFLRNAVHNAKLPRSTLFLIPDEYEETVRFYSPFPGAAQLFEYPERWPGVLMWTRFGDSIFLPLEAAKTAFQNDKLEDAGWIGVSGLFDRFMKSFLPPAVSRHVRILHLSDLHFGTKYAERTQTNLLAQIKKLRNGYDRIVITGDLFDSPFRWKWRQFDNFRNALRLVTDQDPILIPGNHDQRIAGNALWKFGRAGRFLADINMDKVVRDDKLDCLFFCFNSAKAGTAARGEVVIDDLASLGAECDILEARHPEISTWLRIGLVHHHPFKFDAPAEGMTARLLKKFNIPEGSLVDMDHSERLIAWCVDRKIPLLLHGHRHVQRQITQTTPNITAIGCGTSLGAEGVASSFNLISWNSNTRRWSAAFFLDQYGGGFKPIDAVTSRI